jgi:hypothetical protein
MTVNYITSESLYRILKAIQDQVVVKTNRKPMALEEEKEAKVYLNGDAIEALWEMEEELAQEIVNDAIRMVTN